MPAVRIRSLSLGAALYVVIICAAILALEFWREWSSRDAAVLKVQLETHNLARSLRQHAEDSYELAQQAVSAVVLDVEGAGTSPAALKLIDELMDSMVGSDRRLHGVYVYDTKGDIIVSTSKRLRPSIDPATLPFFRNHAASTSRATFYGGPVLLASDNQWVVTISRRFDDRAGHFAGVVMAALDAKYFADFYRDFDVGQRGSISLFEGSGALLSRLPYAPELIGRDFSTSQLFAQRLALGNSGAYEFVSPVDQVVRIGGYDRSLRYPVTALVAISRDEALAAWAQGALQRLLVTALMVLGVALLGIRLADQIARRQRSEKILEQKEAEFRLLAESASDLVERFDAEGNRVYISPALYRLTGRIPEELIGKDAFEMINPDDRPRVEEAAGRLRDGLSEQETVAFRVLHKAGHEIWLETSLRIATENAGVVGVTRDITDRKHLELKLEGMAMRDGLTGLANRRAFDEALAREVARARRIGSPLSLLMIDADRFKRFNDDYGHLAGDACLKSVASVVSMAARRPGDLAARYGGEEMALLLPDTDLDAARIIGAELCRQVARLAIPHGRNLPWQMATISVGVGVLDPSDETAVFESAWLISSADLALYDAKAQGRNQSVSAPNRIRPRMAG